MAHRTTLEEERPAKASKTAKKPAADGSAKTAVNDERERIFEAFRRWGYLEATLDPLGLFEPIKHPALEALTGEIADDARRIYCGTIGADFTHLPELDRQRWIAARIEAPAHEVDQQKILERLIRADLFEQVLQARYLGTKRFSLEGVTALIPLLDSILDSAAESGAVESVDPVAVGRARAKQTRYGLRGPYVDRSPETLNKVVPIVMHGDAAFAGQGVFAETMNFADLKAYTVGGTIHIIVNNLIGFTTRPAQEHSSRFASDLAKRQSVPIFHVNGEDPDAVVRIGKLAAEYRATFGSDVVVDIIGYRRHGHSEVDDPTITQPLLYERIKNHPPLWKIYAEHAGIDSTQMVEAVRKEYEEEQTKARAIKKIPHLRKLPSYWAPYQHGCYDRS